MDKSLYSSEQKYLAALKLRRKPEEYYRMIHERFPNIILSGEYVNQNSVMDAECTICGYKWNPIASVLLNSKGCPKCTRALRGKRSRKTHDQFVEEMSIKQPNIEILSEYQTAKTRIDCRCRVCGHEWDAKATNLLSGFGCRRCAFKRISQSRVKPFDEFVAQLNELDDSIEILGGYESTHKPVKCKCMVCGEEWNGLPSNLLRGEGCPGCKKSHGEKAISRYLDDHVISYETNKRYSGLVGVNGRRLSYDFYLQDYNILIEFQGRQHETPVEQFGGAEQFAIQIEHDNRKRKYAIDNDIHLVEIWYYEIKNVSDILDNILNIGTAA